MKLDKDITETIKDDDKKNAIKKTIKSLKKSKEKMQELIKKVDRAKFELFMSLVKDTEQKRHPVNFPIDISDKAFEIFDKYCELTTNEINIRKEAGSSKQRVTSIYKFGNNIYFGVRGYREKKDCSGKFEFFELHKISRLQERMENEQGK